MEPTPSDPADRTGAWPKRTVYPTLIEGLTLRAGPLFWALFGGLCFAAAAEQIRRGRHVRFLSGLYQWAAILLGIAAAGLWALALLSWSTGDLQGLAALFPFLLAIYGGSAAVAALFCWSLASLLRSRVAASSVPRRCIGADV